MEHGSNSMGAFEQCSFPKDNHEGDKKPRISHILQLPFICYRNM